MNIQLTNEELELAKEALNHSSSKNNEIKAMLMGASDPEVEEIDQVISDIRNKINNNDLNFDLREAEEIKTGLLGLIIDNFNSREKYSSILVKINEYIDNLNN